MSQSPRQPNQLRMAPRNEDVSSLNSAERHFRRHAREIREYTRQQAVEGIQQSDQSVQRARRVLLLSLLVVAALVTLGTGVFLRRDEQEDKHQSYDHWIHTVDDTVESSVERLYGTMRSLSTTISVQSQAWRQAALGMAPSTAVGNKNDTSTTPLHEFPFVTIPAFEALGEAARRQAQLRWISFEPRVENDQLLQWNQFAQDNHEVWLAASRSFAQMQTPPTILMDQSSLDVTTSTRAEVRSTGPSSTTGLTNVFGGAREVGAATRETQGEGGSGGRDVSTGASSLDGIYIYVVEESAGSSEGRDNPLVAVHSQERAAPAGTTTTTTSLGTLVPADSSIQQQKFRVEFAPEYGPGPYFPRWMQSPPPPASIPLTPEPLTSPTAPMDTSSATLNLDTSRLYPDLLDSVLETGDGLMGPVEEWKSLVGGALFIAGMEDDENRFVLSSTGDVSDPHTLFIQPIFEKPNQVESSRVVGVLSAIFSWDEYVRAFLPDRAEGLVCVVRNTCNQSFTYEVGDGHVYLVGPGDLHDSNFDDSEVTITFSNLVHSNLTPNMGGHCVYSLHLYLSSTFENRFESRRVAGFTILVASSFIFICAAFLVFDWMVRRRDDKVFNAASRSRKLLVSLFPTKFRDQLMAHEDNKGCRGNARFNNRFRLKHFLSEGSSSEDHAEEQTMANCRESGVTLYKSPPIAEIFPDVTVMLSDIVGFTAWSSTREPSQVFTLLETIFKAFDDIAVIHNVFKVETVGECYVAVCGLPDPSPDHAVGMAMYAEECLHAVRDLVKRLQIKLGPDTAELVMRFGLHSGPVTAGVLRGERTRFQLFGETMSMASFIERTGKVDTIHVSNQTANLLNAAGKVDWLVERRDPISIPNKGEVTTWYLKVSQGRQSLSTLSEFNFRVEEEVEEVESLASSLHEGSTLRSAESKRLLLVNWISEVLMNLLREMEASRDETPPEEEGKRPSLWDGIWEQKDVQCAPLDEVAEIIQLPQVVSKSKRNPYSIDLPQEVEKQVQDFVNVVSLMYHNNDFHNFEHASHVTMSVVKLMARIVAPDISDQEIALRGDMAATLHDHTYGITSDPLTQFACVISALIHDIDHPGVPNTQLERENPMLAQQYGYRSIAEQNSVDLAWTLLMSPDYLEFRSFVCRTASEEARFRQLVVNSVMATDIADKHLKDLRNKRWDRAFAVDHVDENGNAVGMEESPKDVIDRKATIVIEHLIQASDVAHTMQHWDIYRKWNERLFREMYSAYLDGRSSSDPTMYWYKGELGFFDFYIIPLARKLKECGVFGVSSDEYLNYAEKNREEWEVRGERVVAAMIENVVELVETDSLDV